MKIYSPSSTMEFQRCPMKWWLRKQGVMSRRIANPELAAAVGIGISKGMEVFYGTGDVEASIEAAIEVGLQSVTDRINAGASIVPSCETTFGLIPKRIEKAIRGFHKHNPFPPSWHSFMPELTFPDHGNARADLTCMSDLGAGIIDFKSKVTVQERILNEFLFDAETSHQMYHYVWAAREMGINIEWFAICLIVIEPLHVYLEQWIVNEELLDWWPMNAQYWWAEMERVELFTAPMESLVPKVGDHRDKYGLCGMYDWCMGNEWQRKDNYIQIVKGE